LATFAIVARFGLVVAELDDQKIPSVSIFLVQALWRDRRITSACGLQRRFAGPLTIKLG